MTVKFVNAKSKVVSKDLSIPRIEPLSCLLLSKLVSVVLTLCQLRLLLVEPSARLIL